MNVQINYGFVVPELEWPEDIEYGEYYISTKEILRININCLSYNNFYSKFEISKTIYHENQNVITTISDFYFPLFL